MFGKSAPQAADGSAGDKSRYQGTLIARDVVLTAAHCLDAEVTGGITLMRVEG